MCKRVIIVILATSAFAVMPLWADTSNPQDSDSDGLSDIDEAKIYKTDSQLVDTDTDGLPDGKEVLEYFTNPLISDSDSDSFIDGIEVRHNSDPLDADSIPKPGIVDWDGDGLSNQEETQEFHTDPQRIDSDFDGLSDGDEVRIYFTDALTVDSDGDRYWDGEEVVAGTDPTDADDFPK